MLRVLIDDLTDRCPAEHRESTVPAVVEACHWLGVPLGDGLKSAADCTRNIADITFILCGHHKRVISA